MAVAVSLALACGCEPAFRGEDFAAVETDENHNLGRNLAAAANHLTRRGVAAPPVLPACRSGLVVSCIL